jgi:hypothetical protein
VITKFITALAWLTAPVLVLLGLYAFHRGVTTEETDTTLAGWVFLAVAAFPVAWLIARYVL